jgi:LysM repeat protein
LCLGAALAMGLVAAGFAHADVDETGTTAASFLSLGSGARILSMGGATLGLGDDLAASAWNPAALGWMERGEIVLSHAGLGNGTSQEWAGLGAGWGEKTRWSISGLYQGEGSFEGRDASNISTGQFNVSSFAFGAHVAHRFGDLLTIGAGAKAVNENLGTVSGFGATFDFGASVHAGDFGFGLAAQNLGGQMKYDGAVYSFPGSFGAGVSYAMPSTGLRLALDANFPKSYYNDVRFGAEYMWNDMVAVRAGYRKELGSGDIAAGGEDLLSGPTFGMGAGRNGFWFDYGYLVSGGETQHRIGIRFTPGGFGNYGKVDQPSVAPRKPAAPRSTPAPKTSGRPTIPVTSTTAKPVTPAKESGDDDVPVPTAPDAKAAVPVAAPPKPAVTTPVQPKSAPTKVGSKATPTKIGDLSPAPPATKAVTPATAPSSAPATKPAPKATENKLLASRPVETKAAETKPAEVKAAEVKQPEAKAVESKPETKQPEAKAVESKPEEAKVSEPKPSEATQAPSEPAESKETVARAEEKPAEARPAEVKETKKEEKRKPEPAKVGPRPAKVKVKSGETLAIIAKRYGLSPAAIMMENNMVRDTVKPGQTLRLPREN